jgi:molecular chaperone DnaK (HSP70)
MSAARFSIGIDLGTTNSALAYAPLNGNAPPETLPIQQWETPDTLVEVPMLPSFLYLPEDALAQRLRGKVPGTQAWIVGRLARRRATETPGRVVRSAKSWLCHHTADRAAPILPWVSEDIETDRKISPVRASALILNYLRSVWNNRFADCAFDDQEVTVTVPASFDVAAQKLTLAAAEEARFPCGVKLLEEPQAVFYCWLGQHPDADPLWAEAGVQGVQSRHVLVIDIGGGTSDFSLLEVRPGASGSIPDIRRVAVSEHILLGGDNIDLALAVLLEMRMSGGERGHISGPRWDQLVALCRDLKEKALSGSATANDRFAVALPGRGSGLIAGAQTANLARDEVERLVLDGFFPLCDARARPYRMRGALQEWGLPYAADSAVTHHLADFLRERPCVDAVLFNGGSLDATVLRERLLDQIAAWQDGARPLELENAEPDLAVARGAARFGKLLDGQSRRIAAGAARAVFLQVQTARDEQKTPALLCVLPRNAGAEQVFDIDLPGLEVRTDRAVSFQAWSSTRHGRCRAGDVLSGDVEAFHRLPPLQAIIPTADRRAESNRSVPVRLAAKINALGLLQISCVSTDPSIQQSWPLEFNLRPQEQGNVGSGGQPEAPTVEPNATTEARQAARERIANTFSKPTPKSARLTANSALKHLERSFGLARHEWNAALLRDLWPLLNERMAGRKLSVEHEEAWLTLAGFLLRPGFGFIGDALRMDELWQLHDAGLCFPGKSSKVQEYILWRRVAGGLTPDRQETLLAGELNALRSGRASPELIRLAGSLERLPRHTKADLIENFIRQALQRIEVRQYCAPYLAALGLLLNRAPFHAGPESVVPPEMVARTYAAFQDLDWAEAELLELHMLFLRAARVVGDRSLDVPKSLRNQIVTKLERADVAPARTGSIKAFTPVGRAERSTLYGESLPPGLLLGSDQDAEQ